eukprot:COSAG02_NODE_1242_length_13682_cov_1219.312523_15_plen_51_part_00
MITYKRKGRKVDYWLAPTVYGSPSAVYEAVVRLKLDARPQRHHRVSCVID